MARNRNIEVDVRISGGGSIFKFDPKTEKARDWVKANVELESWQMLGDRAFACEGRYAQDLAKGMLQAGLVVV